MTTPFDWWCATCFVGYVDADVAPTGQQCPRCGSVLEDRRPEPASGTKQKSATPLLQFLAMLRSAGIRYMAVGDMDKLETYKVSVENLQVADDIRVDVEFEFQMPGGKLNNVRARRG